MDRVETEPVEETANKVFLDIDSEEQAKKNGANKDKEEPNQSGFPYQLGIDERENQSAIDD